jgi:predicted nucleotidyltransferase component of viral defense system
MISKNEINDLSASLGLSLDVIEKDYVLGWVLAGINNDAELRDNWVFKGGTCLKKCFFETYRFSEDLDFTLKKESQLSSDFLEVRFTAISEWVYENSGIELPVTEMDFKERNQASQIYSQSPLFRFPRWFILYQFIFLPRSFCGEAQSNSRKMLTT